ncbi:MAG TPA: FAD-dependent oxidoreductase [Candidatus Bathyarchaeia archaeon]|nr:FAD-dependent oxidoreductase [Candidatus Bathyarchaeia archaeon]
MQAIIVGSGAGGATVAKELSNKGVEVLLIEKGPTIDAKEASKYYSNIDSEVEILRTFCLGGTTTVSAGNGVRTLEKELRELGIDLSEEFEDAERELGVRTLPDSHFGEGTKRIMAAAENLGFDVKKMPKFIDPAKCTPCGKCASGCPNGAKWSAAEFVKAAEKNGAKILTDMPVDGIIVKGGEVAGVRSKGKVISADIVVLSAGALETPRLLKKQELLTTPNLFVDTFTTIGGALEGIKLNKEVTMNALIAFEDFILSPHFSNRLVKRMEARGVKVSSEDVLGIMVKIKDEELGEVDEDVKKGVTNRDAVLLSEGAAIAGSILEKAGADPSTFVSTPVRGAHPGGTARIGEAVDKSMATAVSGLYVADASVLPASPGAPPILTIVALAKYVSKNILDRS